MDNVSTHVMQNYVCIHTYRESFSMAPTPCGHIIKCVTYKICVAEFAEGF